MMALKTQALGRYFLISLAIIFSAMVITGCGGGGGDSSSTSGTPNIGLVPATTVPTDFGVTVLGKTTDKHIEIYNTGSADLSIGQITQPAAPFSMDDTCSNKNIPRNSKCVLTVHFAPNTQGDYNGSFEIPSNDSDQGVLTATLTGRGVALATSINRVVREGDTVKVIVSVRDQNDHPVTDLVLNDFSISEDNGSSIPIDNVINIFTPGLSVGMVLDYSSSMIPFTLPVSPNVENASKDFIDLLNPAIDEAEIIKFAADILEMQSFTNDNVLLKDAIDEAPGFVREGTALYDAVDSSITSLSLQENVRRAVIVVSDGQEDASIIQDPTVVTNHANANNVQIFAIGIGDPVDGPRLQTLAGSSDHYFYDPGASDLSNIYSTISEILGNEYTISYTTSSSGTITLHVVVVDPDNGDMGESSKTVTL